MVYTPIANWSNVTSLSQVPNVANITTEGFFWSSVLYLLWGIILMVTLRYGFEAAILTSSFLALIIGFLMFYAGLVSWLVLMSFMGIILFMFLYLTWTSNP